MEPNHPEHFPLIDAVDHAILMHRDAHFGGAFPIMLDYYRKEGKGTLPEFSLPRIERLAMLETQMKENLAALFLTAQEIERVADARQAYEKLRAIYDIQHPKTPFPRLIADLILAEDEEAKEEIAAIVAEKDKIVPALIDLLRQEEFYDPLFPGYGQSPLLAVTCFEQIGDKRAMIALFEALGQGDFFIDDHILKALRAIGTPAKDFLLRILASRPINEDNEKAAIAIGAFKDDPQVAHACLKLLQEPDFQQDKCLSTYLVLACVGLKDEKDRQAFREMAKQTLLDHLLRKDMQGVMQEWEL